MDLLPWYNLNSLIKIKPTVKKFYGKFSHKATFTVYGSRYITSSKTLEDCYKKSSVQNYHNNISLNSFSVHILGIFYHLYHDKKFDIKFRIECNTVNIYSKNLDLLLDICTNHVGTALVNELTTVTDPLIQTVLDQDMIVMKTVDQYRYRVNIRFGYYKDLTARHGLAKYLENLGEEVKITKKLLQAIGGSNKYLSAGYFYVKDQRLVDMIRLITPSLVRSVNQVVYQPQLNYGK